MIHLINQKPLTANQIFYRLVKGYFPCFDDKFHDVLMNQLDFRKGLDAFDVQGKSLPEYLARRIYARIEDYPFLEPSFEWEIDHGGSYLLIESEGIIPWIGTHTDRVRDFEGLAKKLKRMSKSLADDPYRYSPPLKMIYINVLSHGWDALPIRQGYEVCNNPYYSVIIILKQFLREDFFSPSGSALPFGVTPLAAHQEIKEGIEKAQSQGFFQDCIIQ